MNRQWSTHSTLKNIAEYIQSVINKNYTILQLHLVKGVGLLTKWSTMIGRMVN